jgi:hypothetical protein
MVNNLKATRKITSGSTTIHSGPTTLKEIIVSDPGQKCIVAIKDDTTIKMLFTLQQNTEQSGVIAYSIKTNLPIATSLKVEMYRLDPILFLNFNNNSTTLAEDLSGQNADFVLNNMEAADRYEDEHRGKAINFSGTDEYANRGDTDTFDLSPTDDKSISFWIKATSSGGDIFSKVDTAGANGWNITWFGTPARSISFYMKDGSGNRRWVVSDDVCDDDTWTHVVVTHNGTTNAAAGVKIYINGTESSAYTIWDDDTLGTTANARALTIAARNSGASSFFTGKLDEIMIFDKVLSTAEVEFIYRNGYGYGATDGSRLGDITLVYEK